MEGVARNEFPFFLLASINDINDLFRYLFFHHFLSDPPSSGVLSPVLRFCSRALILPLAAMLLC